ncbi:hypothetical protein Taro_056445 [Colocasia esculenta]|uniref:Uncharacterized protein n=1 Tax=Colocasia esculenta TaxID=4460 RepID=A0A843XWH8_COLES|nr:hypothetical protein [Colocasia esculenta]
MTNTFIENFFKCMIRLRGNLKSRWDGPYTVVKACHNGAVIILDPKTGHLFTVNGQRSAAEAAGSPWKAIWGQLLQRRPGDGGALVCAGAG